MIQTFAFSIADAPPMASLNLVVQIAMGFALLFGKRLAQQKRFRAHAICQGTVVCLNLIPILGYMAPIFRRTVLAQPTAAITRSTFYAVPALHGLIGGITEVLALYVLLCAGTNILPAALRFTNYKPWMRTTLTLWWVTIPLGIGTFAVWHTTAGAEQPTAASNRPQPTPTLAIVTARNFAFEPKELTITRGETVTWKGVSGKHTIKADDGGFTSEVVPTNGEFKFKFEKEGRYNYYCTLHGEPGGKDMAGVVIVTAAK